MTMFSPAPTHDINWRFCIMLHAAPNMVLYLSVSPYETPETAKRIPSCYPLASFL